MIVGDDCDAFAVENEPDQTFNDVDRTRRQRYGFVPPIPSMDTHLNAVASQFGQVRDFLTVSIRSPAN